ncbi:phage tail sheath family protein [Sphingomonas sp. DT-204]|uniref:phage tail sheath family protein n=1 Tax=Sphingomonas sp. DT-204 TaxID=3396166 RepID=UPI003F1C32DC
MAAYLSPGVYVEEVSSGPRPIEAVGTSTAGFVGVAPNAGARHNDPVAINNWSEFVREFVQPGDASTDLANAVYGFFLNGGSRCYVVNTGNADAAISGNGRGLDALEAIDEIAIIAAPGRTDVASYAALLDSAERMRDRVAILDGPASVDNVEALTRVATVSGPSAAAAADAPEGGKKASQRPGFRPRESDGGYGAFYYPWLIVRDALDPDKQIEVAPSGHLAGLYARTDAERGVHKAPANLPIRGALSVSRIVSRAEQDVLNPAGVNCIRYFTREGVRVWGARTLAPSASEWRYLNVRRLFNMIEESIAISTRWVVFEPNDRPLWKSIKRDVDAFLTLLWRQGALAGASPEQAFFVRCDAETNPPEVVDAGQVVALIGIAPMKPAEFVIFRIGQSAVGATVELA